MKETDETICPDCNIPCQPSTKYRKWVKGALDTKSVPDSLKFVGYGEVCPLCGLVAMTFDEFRLIQINGKAGERSSVRLWI